MARKRKRSQGQEEDATPEHVRKKEKEGKKRPQEGDATPEPAGKTSKRKRKQPQGGNTTMGPAGPSRRPRQASAPSEDYNIPTRERTELLTNLKNLLKVDSVSPTFWACCQLSDIEKLKVLVNTAEVSTNAVFMIDSSTSVIPRQWTQRPEKSPGSVSVASTTGALSKSNKTKENSDGNKWLERSRPIRRDCIKRDKDVCVLTGDLDPQVAHIFPYSMLNRTANTSDVRYATQASFWTALKVFWTDDQVDKWKNKIFPEPQHPDTGVESCFNLICLSPSAHNHWNKGRFALKPLELSDNEKKLTVQFFWQPQYKHKLYDRVSLLMKPRSSKGLSFVEKDGKPCFLDRILPDRSTVKIESGQVFTLTTDDPNKKPLPSLELLEMQWILQRITAMSGAAGTPELEFNDDDDIDPCPTLIPDDNNRDIRFYFDRLYEWIPHPPLPGKVQYEPNQENPEVLARDMPRQVFSVS